MELFDDEDALMCPRCGGNYLHHEKIIVYTRGEDAEETVVTTISGRETVVQTVLSSEIKNPSKRRHGMTIVFSCEFCEAEKLDYEYELHLKQHKGNTFIGWEEYNFEPDDCEMESDELIHF